MSARHNPFTGLEVYPIIVDETEAEGGEFDDERETEARMFGSGVFDFEGGLKTHADETDDSDIFASPTDSDNEDENTRRVNETTVEACEVSLTAVTKPAQSRAVKKVKQPKDEAQIGFSW